MSLKKCTKPLFDSMYPSLYCLYIQYTIYNIKMDSIYPSLHCMHIELVRCVKVCSISICVKLSWISKFKCTLEVLRIDEDLLSIKNMQIFLSHPVSIPVSWIRISKMRIQPKHPVPDPNIRIRIFNPELRLVWSSVYQSLKDLRSDQVSPTTQNTSKKDENLKKKQYHRNVVISYRKKT